MIFQLWRGVELLNSGQATIEDVATYFAADVDSAIFLASNDHNYYNNL